MSPTFSFRKESRRVHPKPWLVAHSLGILSRRYMFFRCLTRKEAYIKARWEVFLILVRI